MDDGANVDLVGLSPISRGPDRFQVATKQQWRRGGSHSDDEADDIDGVADGSRSRHGSPQLLPRSRRGFGRLKPLTLDTNLPPPFLYSSDHPSTSTVEGTPSPLSYTSDYFGPHDSSPLPPTKVKDSMRLHQYSHLTSYDPEELGGAYTWDIRSSFPVIRDVGDSDASEPPDESKGYITFAGRSASLPLELELGFKQPDLSESSVFSLDFPEDVSELLDHDAVSANDDLGVIGCLGRPTLVPVPEITIESPVRAPEGSQNPYGHSPKILLPRTRESPEGSDNSDSFLHLPYPGADVADVPINVDLSPLILATDGFPHSTSPQCSGLVEVGIEGISAEGDWSEGLWGEIICTPFLEEDLVEWDRWREELIEELDRDLDSWARVHESVREGLDRF